MPCLLLVGLSELPPSFLRPYGCPEEGARVYGCVPHHPRTLQTRRGTSYHRRGRRRRGRARAGPLTCNHPGHGERGRERRPSEPRWAEYELDASWPDQKVHKLCANESSSTQAPQPLESAVPLRPWSREKDDGGRQEEEGTTGSFSNAEPAAPRAPQAPSCPSSS